MKTPDPTFKLHTIVAWESGANGKTTTKTGKIVAVVPAYESQKPLIMSLLATMKYTAKVDLRYNDVRKTHESYIVAVSAPKRSRDPLYRPVVSYLRTVASKSTRKTGKTSVAAAK